VYIWFDAQQRLAVGHVDEGLHRINYYLPHDDNMVDVRHIDRVATFKRHLKTMLFIEACSISA